MKKGSKMTKESCLKMSLSHKGKPSNRLGIPHTTETKEKLKQYKGEKCFHFGKKLSEETKLKMSLAKKGTHWKHSDSIKGERNNNWKGGVTPINKKIRYSIEYKLWRTAVFKRDNYTCIWCRQKGGNLSADHIQLFSTNPELRFAIDNGRTLCKSCHLLRHRKIKKNE